MNKRAIIHCDMNNFYASVELLDYPELKDKPVAICGNPAKRHGIILAKNQPAKNLGIVTAETVYSAQKKCKDLILLPPHMSKYKRYSKLINEIYLQYTDMVEPYSIDESWLDVTSSQNLFGSGKVIADKIRTKVYNELGLQLSAGVSFNKIFAKMGSEYKKPFATTEITEENFKSLLWPLKVGVFFGAGKSTSQKLNNCGIKTIGDLANAPDSLLKQLLGKNGIALKMNALGLNLDPVCEYSNREPLKSIGNGITFNRNLEKKDDIKIALIGLADKVASRMRKHQVLGYTVKLTIKDTKFTSIVRQKKLSSPTNLAEDIYNKSFEILKNNWKIGAPIRLLTITLGDLIDEDSPIQISIFDDDNHSKSETLERTMDDIRKKYGTSSITYGKIINNDIGIDLDHHIFMEEED